MPAPRRNRHDVAGARFQEDPTYQAELSVAGKLIGFITDCRDAYEHVAALPHLLCVEPFVFRPVDEPPSGRPTMVYLDSADHSIDFDEATSMLTVRFPWSPEVGDLWETGRSFRPMLLYPLRMLVELLWQQAGEYLLHASAVVRDGRAIVLTGGPEAGKTTTALHLCHEYGYSHFANDQALLTMRDGRPWIVLGDGSIYLRFASVAAYSPPAAERIFGDVRAPSAPWDLKKEIHPDELGVASFRSPAPLAVLAKIRLDNSVSDCVVQVLGGPGPRHVDKRVQQTEFGFKIELYNHITSAVRGAHFTPCRDADLRLEQMYMPDMDRPEYLEKRVAFLNALFDGQCPEVLVLRGPLERCCEVLTERLEALS